MSDLLAHLSRWMIAAALALFAATSAAEDKRPHPCAEPPGRPTAELLPLAESGDPEAQYLLGLRYDVGDRFENTWSKGATW